MNVLDLAHEIGLQPKKVSATGGGEYKSSCPGCKEGEDRFCIWPNEGNGGRYWCRKCGLEGDAIQFCRDFMHLSYNDACSKLKVPPKTSFRTRRYYPFKKTTFSPQASKPVSEKWQDSAREFIERSHQKLLTTPYALDLLLKRGFTLDTLKPFILAGMTIRFSITDRFGDCLPRSKKMERAHPMVGKGHSYPRA